MCLRAPAILVSPHLYTRKLFFACIGSVIERESLWSVSGEKPCPRPCKDSDQGLPCPSHAPNILVSPGKIHPLLNNLLRRQTSADDANKIRLAGKRRSELATLPPNFSCQIPQFLECQSSPKARPQPQGAVVQAPFPIKHSRISLGTRLHLVFM